MLDYHFLQWSWSQRFIVISYITSFYFVICKPYASINSETIQKSYMGALNLLCYATMICLFITCLQCFGYYRIKAKTYIYGTFGCIGANIFFLLVAFTKDKRLPTVEFFMGILFVTATIACVWYDITHYKYEER